MLMRLLLAFKGAIPWAATPGGVGPNLYPLDLNAADRNTRFGTPPGYDVFPWPSMIGAVSGFMPQQNAAIWAQAIGKNPYGPGINAVPGTQPFTNFGTVTTPMLPKMTDGVQQISYS